MGAAFAILLRHPVKPRRLVNEKNAVQMVDLVLEHPGQKAVPVDPNGLSFRIETAHHDASVPLDVAVDAGDAEAPLPIDIGALALFQHGIDDMNGALARVDDD